MGGEESSDALRNYNPTFELVYTGYTLDVANEWRAWLGLAPDPRYEAVAGGLAALPLDPGSADAGVPRYTLNLLCACYYLEVRGGGRASGWRDERRGPAQPPLARGEAGAQLGEWREPSLVCTPRSPPPPPIGAPQGSTANPACNASWLPPGGTSCQALASHPLVVAPLGMVNGRARGDRYGVSAAVMNTTVASVRGLWENWTATWGWDDVRGGERARPASALLDAAFPHTLHLHAGPPRHGNDAPGLGPRSHRLPGEEQVDELSSHPQALQRFLPPPVPLQLLDPKFSFWVSGQTVCCPTYLPGNGGLLLAVAMLAGGSDTSPPDYFPAAWGAAAEGFDVPYP